MKLFNNLPLYEALIADETCGTFCVSLVTDPATEVNFIAFDEDKKIEKFAVKDKVERMVSGVIMLASTPIYRRTADNFEYYITYSKDTLKTMAEKMIFDGVGSQVNIQHQDGSNVEGVNLVELYIIDREKGIAPEYFANVPDGSLIGTYKVHNDEVWNMIENGDVLSFSLEGIFQIEETFNKQENNNNTDKYNKTMSKLNKIKEMLKSILVEFGEVSTDKGVIVFDGDELEAGMTVRGVDEEGNEVALEDGDYRTEDKKIITIEGGKVVSIEDIDAEVSSENPEETPEEMEDPQPETDPEPEAEPEVDEKDELIKQLQEQIAALTEENNQLKERIAELEKEPNAPSAEEAFSALEEDENTPIAKMRKRGYKI